MEASGGRHGRTEASVLSFTREQVCDGVQLARIALRPGESSTFHSHTATRDTFFVMHGQLSIDIRVGSRDPTSLYHAVYVRELEPRQNVGGELVHRLHLTPGDVCIIVPGVVHCASNLTASACHFLCIEGVGAYDFIEIATNSPGSVEFQPDHAIQPT